MLNRLASHAMSTHVLKALPGKLDIKGPTPSILYFLGNKFREETAIPTVEQQSDRDEKER